MVGVAKSSGVGGTVARWCRSYSALSSRWPHPGAFLNHGEACWGSKCVGDMMDHRQLSPLHVHPSGPSVHSPTCPQATPFLSRPILCPLPLPSVPAPSSYPSGWLAILLPTRHAPHHSRRHPCSSSSPVYALIPLPAPVLPSCPPAQLPSCWSIHLSVYASICDPCSHPPSSGLIPLPV